MIFIFRIITLRAAGDESSMGEQSSGHPLAGLVERGGFEPPKASPTDLQSVPFGRSGTSPAQKCRFFDYLFQLQKTY